MKKHLLYLLLVLGFASIGQTIPYSQTFTWGTTFPSQSWTEKTGTLTATSTLSGTSSNWTYDGFGNNGTSGAAGMNIWSTNRHEWLISPSFTLANGTVYTVEFDIAATEYASNTLNAVWGSDDALKFVVSYDNGATWSTSNVLETWDASNPSSRTGTHHTYAVTGQGGSVKFGFYATSTVANEDIDVFVDNFSIITPCSGTPAVGATATNLASTCSSAVTLSLPSYSMSPGETLQWESGSTSLGPWTAIAGETSQTATVTQIGNTYYRCAVTCANGGAVGYSSPILISSTPSAGDATTTKEIVCDATTTFDLGLTNNITSTGLTYQWQSSATETGTYSDITGATTSTYTATQASTKYYRCKVSCPSALTVEYSTPVRVLFGGTIPAGSYTVGTGGNYASLDDVRLALGCGVAGAVTFNILPGTYTETMTLGVITGATSTAKVTFQKAPNTSGAVIITHPTATNIIRLNGTDNVVFKNLTFESSNRIIEYTGDCDNLSFIGNTFTGTSGLSTSSTNTAVYGTGNATGVWKFIGNTVSGLGYGFYLANTTTIKPDSVQFTNNNIEVGYYGIYSSNAIDFRAQGNTISSESTTPYYGIYATSIDSNVVLKNNTISSPYYYSLYGSTRGLNGATPEITIVDNEVATRYYGVYGNIAYSSTSSTATSRVVGALNLSRNTVLNSSTGGYGVYANMAYDASFSSLKLDSNDIELPGFTSSAYGIYVYGYSTATNQGSINGGSISNNNVRINTTSTLYGLYTYFMRSDAPVIISNNIFSSEQTTGTGYSVYLYYADNIKFWNNTIWHKGGSATASRALYINNTASYGGTGAGTDIQNNLIIKDDQGYAVEIANATNLANFNNNTYFGSTSTLLRKSWSPAGNHNTIAAWNTATGLDANSTIGDPVINSFTDPRVQGLAVSNNGTALGVLKDYFGTTRSTTTPDRGIHEFDYSPCFLAVNASVTERNINSLVLEWSSKNTAKLGTQFRFRKVGTTAWTYQFVSTTGSSFKLSGLNANSTYEIALREVCNAQDTGLWGNELVYGTTLCAYSPALPSISFNTALNSCVTSGWDIVSTDQYGATASLDGSQFARVNQAGSISENPVIFETRAIAMPSNRKQLNLDYYVGDYWTSIRDLGVRIGSSGTISCNPFRTGTYRSHKIAYLILASELNLAGYQSGSITGLSIAVDVPGSALENMTISAGVSSLTDLGSLTIPSTLGTTPVFTSQSYQPVSGLNNFLFSSPIIWNGTDNLIIEICFFNSALGTNSEIGYQNTFTNSGRVTYSSTADVCSNNYQFNRSQRPQMYFDGLETFTSPLSVDVSEDDGVNWTSIFTLSKSAAANGANSWKSVEIDLNSYIDDPIRLRFKGNSSGTGLSNSGVAIDNISITDYNACKRPVNLALANTAYVNPLNSSVEFAWNAGISGETQWQVSYGAAGHTAGAGTTVTVSTTPSYKLTGLTQGTTYDIYVRATCGVNTYSAWVGPLRITTACVVPAASSLENFDASNWTSSSLSECWSASPQSTSITTYGWKVGTGSTPTSSTGPASASSPTKYMFVEADGGTTGAEAILRAPFIATTGINYPEVAFDYHMYGSTMGKLYVDVSLDSGETWMTKDSIVGSQQTSTTGAWRTKNTGLYGFGDKSLLLVRLRYQRGTSTTGDVAIDNFEVRDGCALDLSSTLTANPSCNGETDGAIVAQVENANGPVLYRLGTTGSFDTIVEFNNLAAGVYTLYARDSFSCETSMIITLTEPAVISSTATIVNASCFGSATGTLELIPAGGTAPYSYEWSKANDTTFMEVTRSLDSLMAGTYTVDIVDARGCTYSVTYTVGEAPEIIASTVSRSTVSCIAQDGSIVLGVTGGTGAKTVVWNTTPVQTGLTATGLAVGSYTATITDANGCVVTYTEQVLPADTVGSAVAGTTDVSCWGQADGTATLNGVGGQAPYTFFWGTNPPQTTQTAVNLLPGTYTGIVTDAKGCTSSKTVTIGYADTTAPALVTKPATLSLDAAGMATLTATDVVLSAADGCGIITTSLSKTAFSCSDLGANTVQVTVTDGVGNTTTLPAVVTVVDNVAPMFNTAGSPVTLTLSATGSATLTASQAANMISDNCGTPTLTFSKSLFNCADRGMNSVTVTATDASGNTATATIQVNVVDNSAPTITLNAAPITVVLNASGTGSITMAQVGSATDNCGTPTVSLSTMTFSCANVGVNQVVLTATDASGNVSTATKTVTVVDNTIPAFQSTPSNVVVGSCNSVVNYAYTASDNCSYTITRTAGLASGSTFPVGVTTVTHTVTDASGNTANHSFTVTVVDGAPTLPTLSTYCPSDAPVNLTGGQNGLVFSGPGVVGGTQFDPSQASVGQNSLTYSYTDANGCLHTGAILATVNAAPAKPTVALVSPTLLDAQGVQASSYQWYYAGNVIAGGTNKTQAVIGYGVYEVEVSNGVGCTTRSNGLDYSANGLGMYDLIQGLIQVMPVPAVDKVTLMNSTGLDIEQVVLYSMSGQVIYEIKPNSMQNEVIIDVADLPSGLYFIGVKVAGEQTVMKRIEKI